MAKDQLAVQFLCGKGVEFGALHNPVPLNEDKASVQYADKLFKHQAIEAFPELEDVAENIVETDFIVDLDRDSLSVIKEQDFDFVIANHVIEHLVNPISFLKRVHDNLKTDGLFLLTVPNMEYTHDSNRKLSRYKVLLLKYYLGVKRLSNSRIRDYLNNKHEVENVHPKTREYFIKHNLPLSYYEGNTIPLNPISRRKLFNYHRGRSIHVHVWNRETFDFFLRRTIDVLKLNFSIEHQASAADSHGEMVYLLKKI